MLASISVFSSASALYPVIRLKNAGLVFQLSRPVRPIRVIFDKVINLDLVKVTYHNQDGDFLRLERTDIPHCCGVSLNFSQIELRIDAFYCRDSKMLETYRTGGDIHAQTVLVIFSTPFIQAIDKSAPDYKERRILAKNRNFGVFY